MEHWKNKPMPPFNQHLGFEIVEWSQGQTIIMATVNQEHCNHSGSPHGGFISTLLDAASALPGLFCDDPDRIRKALTLSLNINFIGQARGDELKAIGKLTGSGRKIFYSTAEVYDKHQTLVASSQGVFRYRSGSEVL